MAKDDANVLVYIILEYLNKCLKKGQSPDMELISPEALGIEYGYWKLIFRHLHEAGLVYGVYVFTDNIGTTVQVEDDELGITFEGINYLNENSIMTKIKENIRDIAFPLLNLMAKMGLHL